MITKTVRPLILSNEFPPGVWGGLGIAVYGLCQALRRRGCPLGVITHQRGCVPGQPLEVRNENVDDLPVLRCISGEMTLADLEEHMDAGRYDLVHVHGVHFAELASAMKEQLGLPVVYSMHSNASIDAHFDPKLRQTDLLSQEKLLSISKVVFVQTRSAALEAEQFAPALKPKLAVIANGLPPWIEAVKPEIRRLDPKGRITCLYCGWFHPRKGLDVLLEALPAFLQGEPRLDFVFIGGHSSQYASRYRSLLMEIAKKEQRIQVVDWLEPAEMVQWYRRAAAVVIPSLYEPFGNVAIEAMAMGIPVVASDIGGLREILQPGKTGVLVPPGDSTGLASGLLSLISDPEAYTRLSRKAADAARRKYRWDKLVELTMDYYSRVGDQRQTGVDW